MSAYRELQPHPALRAWVECYWMRREGAGEARAQRVLPDGCADFLFDRAAGQFGSALANLGDLDGDGVVDLAVGSNGDQDGGTMSFDHRGAAWVLFLATDGTVRAHQKISLTQGGPDGIATFDFSVRDDALRTPLRNGEAVRSPAQFARTLSVSSAGANLGPAIFDSTPLGPNDPSQDRDLLVGLGNVLILQNSLAPTQSVAGIFDRPNDDQDGGMITFHFTQGPVAPLAITLVDIDLGAEQSAAVRLFDLAGKTRTWAIPAGWTQDLLVHGPPAFRTLDLTHLEPQPGFLATATASEAPGFDAQGVTRLEVVLGSSGALDDLRFDPHPGP